MARRKGAVTKCHMICVVIERVRRVRFFFGLSRQGGVSGGKRGGGQLLAGCLPEPKAEQGQQHPGNQCPEHQQDQHHHDSGPGGTLDQSLCFIGHEAPAGKQRHRC